MYTQFLWACESDAGTPSLSCSRGGLMFDNFPPIADAESLPLYRMVLKLAWVYGP